LRKVNSASVAIQIPAPDLTRMQRVVRPTTLALLLLLCSPAAAVDYPIIAVRAPRYGDEKATSWQEVVDPVKGEPGSDLVIIETDGTEHVLVDAGENGMVLDPSPSLDGKWVYFAFVPNQRSTNSQIRNHAALTGSDICKVNVETGELVRLTHQEWTPALGVAKWAANPTGSGATSGQSALGYGIYNTGPCEVPGGRVVFTSSRNGYVPPKGNSFPNLQLFAMDTDGRNVEQVGYLNVSSALHPVLLKNGHIAWSSWEAQGTRHGLQWGLWSSMPDGREWGPLMSAFIAEHALHFQTQQPDGKIAVVAYYAGNNAGFGTIYRFPHNPQPPADVHAFHSPTMNQNPAFKLLYGTSVMPIALGGYTPWGTEVVTAFTNHFDIPSGPHDKPGQERFGKVTHPAAGPDGLLMVYSPGPVNFQQPPYWPAPQGKIAWLPYDKTAIEHPSELTIVKEDPAYNYQQPRPLLSWREIYGSDPVELPFNPNDGATHPKLPKGTPFGIVGTSSVYNRNSDGNGAGPTYDIITYQGGDVGKFNNSDIHAIRIIQTLPQSHRGYTYIPGGVIGHYQTVGWRQAGPAHQIPNERMKIIGEVPLRKFDSDGEPIRDAKGDPDTSFQARIPADVPFTFQLIDKKGKVLVHSQTWHQLRPGEKRVNCGGCHAHAESPVDFNLTEAAKDNYVIRDLFEQPRDVEWHRDAKPIVEAECKTCHTTDAKAKAKMDLTDTLVGFAGKTLVIQARISPTVLAAEGQPPHQAIAPDKVRTLAEWIDLGMGVDEGKYFDDNINPTLTVASPARDEAASTIVFGAFDNESGLDLATLRVTLNGVNITDKFVHSEYIWSTTLAKTVPAGTLRVEIRDKQGNLAFVDRSFAEINSSTSIVSALEPDPRSTD
jgi:hypothetical protein